MKRIKDVLKQEIDTGKINWEKLEKKIFAAIGLVDNNFETIRPDKKIHKMKFSDSLTFKVTFGKNNFKCYKVWKPRFIGGLHSNLFCSGLQIGDYDLKGKPYFPSAGVYF